MNIRWKILDNEGRYVFKSSRCGFLMDTPPVITVRRLDKSYTVLASKSLDKPTINSVLAWKIERRNHSTYIYLYKYFVTTVRLLNIPVRYGLMLIYIYIYIYI